ncbi:carbamate kinase [Halolactibacillus alkaliphilus]|uniref:Carbamate kinase n=1 Tax=Halolactibacillus alkaliphilus TaxID=442899 RepID=A0A511X0R3_9BACI|nr:carbamate kinase [Halolactibacillus alkaliphilus]GEN56538.1 carbamate kinase [Halolactibacillus alkaliphilus]GGN69368.1 carbamate kinase [Halolactibacillus alkaliphilus]SFO74922.1 carbamate kinase [Halolactibacillus alkaliphilus]
MSKILIALGGNALGENSEEQRQLTKQAAKPIVDMIEQGHDVILSHGNGPQVGAIHLAFSKYAEEKGLDKQMPFAESGAMSQGYIGYHLQNALREELETRGLNRSVASIVSQVLVDKNDPAFEFPTKPIGPFYTKEESERLMKETGDIYIEDSGRGYRKVIPSPVPVDIVEKDIMKDLIEKGHIVIGAGGGGIPVVKEGKHKLVGVEAVIDKDLASECLAEVLDVDFFFILTGVDQVAINFGKPDQKALDSMSVKEAKEYILEGQFPKGSMLPKVEAAIKFVESKKERKAIISSLERAKDAVEGKTGTVIYKDRESMLMN